MNFYRLTPPCAFSRDAAELHIFGDIGESWSEHSVTAAQLVKDLAAIDAQRIVVRINSYGGSVADGLAIYNSLREHPAEIEVRVDGVAVSIASLIAMAGDRVLMAEASLLMIHAPWGGMVGNAQKAREFADTLDRFASAMAEAYARKTGKPVSDVLALLTDGADHWFTAAEAVDAGYADAVATEAQASTRVRYAGLQRFLDNAPARIAASLRLPTQMERQTMPNPNDNSGAQGAAGNPQAAADQRRVDFQAMLAMEAVQALPLYRDLARAAADPNESAEHWRNKIMMALGSRSEPCGGGQGYVQAYPLSHGFGLGGQPEGFIQAAGDALLMRSGIKIDRPHPAASDLRPLSMVDIARACLSRSGRTIGSDSPHSIIRAAMSHSDFPLILSDSLRKSLRRGIESEPATHRRWVRVTEAGDFRPQQRPILGSAPDLHFVPEGGEYTYGKLAEDRSTLVPEKFGRQIPLTVEALLADNLGAFLGLGSALGRAAMRAEADKLYGLLLANAGEGQELSDGDNLFDNARNNTLSVPTGTGKPLTAAALGQARAKMRRQVNVGGGLLNLAPRVLLVPPEREHEAEVLVAASTIHVNQSSVEAGTPAWISSLIVVAEPRLANTDVVYLVASPEQVDCAEVSVVDGTPHLDDRSEDERDVHIWLVRHWFAAGFLDFRGIMRLTLTAT